MELILDMIVHSDLNQIKWRKSSEFKLRKIPFRVLIFMESLIDLFVEVEILFLKYGISSNIQDQFTLWEDTKEQLLKFFHGNKMIKSYSLDQEAQIFYCMTFE